MAQHSDLPEESIPATTEGEAYASERRRVVYRVTFGCGHAFRRAFYGTAAERYDDLSQAQVHPCFACEQNIWEIADRAFWPKED